MQFKQNPVLSLLGAGVCAAAMLAATVRADDVTGTWTLPTRGGSGFTLELKADGTNLTGISHMPPQVGRGNGSNEISNGRIDGNKISFDVIAQDRTTGLPVTNSYEGTLIRSDRDHTWLINGTMPAQEHGTLGTRRIGPAPALARTNEPARGTNSYTPPPPGRSYWSVFRPISD